MSNGADRMELDLEDLDEEDLKALAEVSKKGYYHGRPRSDAASQPVRIEAPTEDGEPKNCKRIAFDDYQRKWDHFDKEDAESRAADTSEVVSSSPARMSSDVPAALPPAKQEATFVEPDEAVVAQLTAMGFDVDDCRAAAVATNNQSDAAVEYLLGGRQNSSVSVTSSGDAEVSLLVEMGFAEAQARAALASCGNSIEKAVEAIHLGKFPDHGASLLVISQQLTELKVEVEELESASPGLPSLPLDASALTPRSKRVRSLMETLTQLSCGLDAIDGDDVAIREARRTELLRCNALEARLTYLRTGGEEMNAVSADAPLVFDEREATREAKELAENVLDSEGVVPAALRLGQAERLRVAGNDAFKTSDFVEAVKNYRAALDLDGESAVILSNLAAAEIRLGEFDAAVTHAGAANELSGGFSAKALFRQGQALEGLARHLEACKSYERALAVEPGDRTLQQRLDVCRGLMSEPA